MPLAELRGSQSFTAFISVLSARTCPPIRHSGGRMAGWCDSAIKFLPYRIILSIHKEGTDYGGIVVVSDLGIEETKIYRVRKFACLALKGKGNQTGIRIIYAYFKDEDRIEFVEIYFIR